MPRLRRCLSLVLTIALAIALAALSLWVTAPAAQAAGPAMRITELAYGGLVTGASGGDGEYVELTNTGDAPQDLTGWTYGTKTDTAAAGLSLSSLGSVAAGESVIVTDLSAAEFRTEWGLKPSVKVLSTVVAGATTHPLNGGPNSATVWDASAVKVDSVTYPSGFFGAKGKSAWVDAAHLGAMGPDMAGWTLSAVADSEGSWAAVHPAAIGSPGASTRGTSTPADVRNPVADPNASNIVINEITSNNNGNGFTPLDDNDLIELYNKGAQAVDLTGWKQADFGTDFSTGTAFAGGLYVDGVLATSIPSHDYGVFSSGPGLSSGGDTVKIYSPDGTLVDSLTYAAGQAGQDETINTAGFYTALAACPNGGDTFLEVQTHSFGADNTTACATGVPPLTSDPEAPCQTENSGTAAGTIPPGVVAWPGGQSPATIDAQCAWVTSLSGQDLSGLAFDPSNANVLYAVKNKSHVWRLVRTGGAWVKDTGHNWANGKDLRFPGNTGLPDSEGLTVGPDGMLYITTERDNGASGVPLDSILKFDPTSDDTTLVASDQWLLTSDLNVTGADANLGFEGVAYVPDSFLTSAGFKKDDGTAYHPADYPTKILPGLFFGAVEKTGHLRAYVLNSDHSFARVADVDTGMVGVMDAQYDSDLGRIWAHCDNTCGNATTLLKVGSDGHFAVDRSYSTPTNLPNYNLEGFVVAPVSTATNGTREVLWTDDGNRFGHSLWGGTVNVALGLSQTATPSPSIGGSAVFGQTLTATVGTWDPGVTTHYTWKDGSAVLATDGPLALTDPALVGKTITLAVTGSKPGFTDTTTTATTVVAAAALTAPAPTISGTAKVGLTLTATAAWGPGSVQLAYAWLANGQPIAGANGSTLRLSAAQVGASITVRVTGTEPGYATATVSSNPTGQVQPGTISATKPTVKGTAKVGKKLTAVPGAWGADGSPVTLDYQWYADGKAIKGATRAKLKLKKKLEGKKITVKVTGTAPGYSTTEQTSKATKVH